MKVAVRACPDAPPAPLCASGNTADVVLEVARPRLADYLERHPESLIRGRREGSDKK